MIRKLTESDRTQTLAFLGKEAAINLFIIGDIEQDGFSAAFQELWGSFDEKDTLNGMLLRYETSYIPYALDEHFDFSPFIEIIKQDKKHNMISGKGSILSAIADHFCDYKKKETYFCELKTAPTLKSCPYEIKIAQVEDAKRICEFLNEIEEFSDSTLSTPEQLERVISSGSGRTYYTETPEGVIRNAVQTAAENSLSAMIVGVATRKAFRHQGLMSSCLSKLCNDLITLEGKSLCLFYDNPEAGKIYHQLGFESIDHWTMLARPK